VQGVTEVSGHVMGMVFCDYVRLTVYSIIYITILLMDFSTMVYHNSNLKLYPDPY
jgi:hypothetical protein